MVFGDVHDVHAVGLCHQQQTSLREEANHRVHLARSHWWRCRLGLPEPRLSEAQHHQRYKDVADRARLKRQRHAWSAWWCDLIALAPEAVKKNFHDLDVRRHSRVIPCRRRKGWLAQARRAF